MEVCTFVQWRQCTYKLQPTTMPCTTTGIKKIQGETNSCSSFKITFIFQNLCSEYCNWTSKFRLIWKLKNISGIKNSNHQAEQHFCMNAKWMCGCMLENRVRKLSLSCATLNFNIYIQTMIASIYKRDITSPMLVAFHSKFASYLHQKSTNSAMSQQASRSTFPTTVRRADVEPTRRRHAAAEMRTSSRFLPTSCRRRDVYWDIQNDLLHKNTHRKKRQRSTQISRFIWPTLNLMVEEANFWTGTPWHFLRS